MSRDLTPMELDYIQKITNMPNITDNLFNEDGSYVYNDEQREMTHKYNRLGMFGFGFLELCRENGLLNKAEEIIQQIEDYFNGADIDKNIAETAQKWYEGNLEPGYYMEDNNIAFYEFVKRLCNKE